MKKIASIGFALLMIFAVFVPFAAANDGAKETKGYLYVDLACRSPQIGGEFSIAPAVVSATFTDGARADPGFVNEYVKYMGAVKVVQFLPQGQVDLQVEPGTYVLAMQDGNNGQPEFILVTLNTGEKQVVQFLGHGISQFNEKQKDIITVTEATYGMTKVVVDVPAQDIFHPAVPGTPAHYEYVGHNHGDYDKFTHHGNTYYIYVGHNHGDYDYVAATPGTPAYTEHIPAVTHVEGEFIDVTAEVQQALDNGAQTMKFRNDFNPGGIFTTDDQLIVQVTDPAYGQVKSVHIVFTVNGGAPQTVDTMEYEVFTLA